MEENKKKWIQEATCRPYTLKLKYPLEVVPFKVACKARNPTEDIIIEKQILEWKNKNII